MFWEILGLGVAFGLGAFMAESFGIMLLSYMMKDDE